MTLPVCHSLWTGHALPNLAAACLESFVRQGHQVVLHAYYRIEAPVGVVVSDAAKILPLQPVGAHRGHGAVPVFSDWFRYELLGRTDGIWIDADLICVRPITLSGPYLFGIDCWTTGRINNAVLGLPAGSQVLQRMRGLFPGRGFIPPWFGPVRRFRYRVKHLCGVHKDITTLPHSSSGPLALTWYAQEAGVAECALPPDVFYPLSVAKCGLALDGDFDVASVITPRTRCVHLWNNSLPRATPHPRSLIGRLLKRDLGIVPA